ncbi:MAG: hypothetical protein KDA28_00465, partial [Phycisphaerales bacterium]|nr:hypothetical protein [Phycisphaerales bacterium]
MHVPILRWGEPYESLDVDHVIHFESGERLAEVSRANPGLLIRDMRQAQRAREVLRHIPIFELCGRLGTAADAYLNGTVGGTTPQEFIHLQAATTGLPEHLCRLNMEKLHHVLTNLERIIGSLTRGLPAEALTDGRTIEDGVTRSRQATSPVLGLVLPS